VDPRWENRRIVETGFGNVVTGKVNTRNERPPRRGKKIDATEALIIALGPGSCHGLAGLCQGRTAPPAAPGGQYAAAGTTAAT